MPLFYLNVGDLPGILKTMGIRTMTRTARPLRFPGSQRGISLATLIASSSHPPPIRLTTFTFETDPSTSTTKTTMTTP